MHTDYAHKLEEEKKTLTAELHGLGKRNPANNAWEATAETADPSEMDQNSIADRFEAFEEASALVTPLEARLKEVDAALGRIKSGTFGNCRVCGNAIEAERLAANPAAETCMADIEK